MNIPANFRLLYIRQINIARKFEERSIISARPRAEQWNDILGRRQIHIWPRCLLAPHWLQNEVPGACAAFIWSINAREDQGEHAMRQAADQDPSGNFS